MMLRLALNDDGAPEVFRSLQGEGRNIGRVRTFVRLSGCNLHCVWCDTAYTWNWEGSSFPHERDRPGAPHKFDPAAEMAKAPVEDVCALIAALPAEGVVITGGEPLMQADAVLALIQRLKAHDPLLQAEIETNGTIAPGDALAAAADLFMVSPKLAHSGNEPAVALKPDVLRAFAALPHAYFKFVARDGEDVEEAATLARSLGVPPRRVYIMPEGTTADVLKARAPALGAATLVHGFNYTDRLHIHLFGQARGV